MHVDVSFPGGLAVNAHLHGFEIATDQPTKVGGAGAAPTPFDLFIASIASCAGLFALTFCRERGIDTRGLALGLDAERGESHGMFTRIRLELTLPDGFPDKYRAAIVRAVDQCTVKRHLAQPPTFEVQVLSREAATIGAGQPSA